VRLKIGYDLTEVGTLMARQFLLLIWILLNVLPSFTQQDRSQAAREELNQGVKAYRAANYDEAIRHFENAVRMDPELKVGRLYLATAYAQEYVPGVETPENLDLATKAIDQYNQVLRLDPLSMSALKGIAFLNLQLKHFDEARQSYKKAIQADPNDPETYYSVGVIDWSVAYRDITTEKTKQKLQPEDAVIQLPACKDLRAAQLANIEEGLAMLARAIEMRKDYDDAMVYTNLLYHLRADIQCGDAAAFAADIKKANDWADQAMAARKARAKKVNGGIVIDSQRPVDPSSK
jgi:tetratricopeptide (TPR) repeat protein